MDRARRDGRETARRGLPGGALAGQADVVGLVRKPKSPNDIAWSFDADPAALETAVRQHEVTHLIHAAWDMNANSLSTLERDCVAGSARLFAAARAGGVSRLIFISSISAFAGARSAYGRSKLCNILFTRELASRLDPAEVVATCLHPGFVATRIGQRGGFVELGWRLMMRPFMLSPEKGAQTSVFLATAPDPVRFHGGYVTGNTLTQSDPVAQDGALAHRLWVESAQLVGI